MADLNDGALGAGDGADAAGSGGELFRPVKEPRDLFRGYSGVYVRVVVNPEEALRAQSLRLAEKPIGDFVKGLLRGARVGVYPGPAEKKNDAVGAEAASAEEAGPLLGLQILLTGLLTPETPWCAYSQELSVLQAVALVDDVATGNQPYDSATATTWQISNHGFLNGGGEKLAARVYEGIAKTVGDFILDFYAVNVIDFNEVNARGA